MLKRKFDEISSAASRNHDLSDRAKRLQRQQLEGLLEQGKKALFRSLKVARGFERQKLGRRQKTAKAEGNDADSVRLSTEVAALKSLDLAVTAETHLYKTLLKIKSVASAPSFPHHVQTTVETSRKQLDPASANVQARLFKSTPVQEAMAQSLNDIRALLGVSGIQTQGKKRLRAKNLTNGSAGDSKNALSHQKAEPGTILARRHDDEWRGFSDPEESQQDLGSEDSDNSAEQYDLYASRLAASSEEDSEDGSPRNAGSLEDALNPQSITEENDADSPSSDHYPKPRKRPPATTSTSTNSTTFLPSLAMGGYWSGSESASDLSDERSQERKNKRGQRARRALWEKKYGKNANHLKKQPQNRDEGWDARRGASSGDGRGKRGRGRGRGAFEAGTGRDRERVRGRGPTSSGANSDPVAVKKKEVVANHALHPSWEAAKKAKEQKKTLPFQGKKVLFD